MFDRLLNTPPVRVLRTLGLEVDHVRAEGPWLFDAEGKRLLDLVRPAPL